jgi:hypothetical protein
MQEFYFASNHCSDMSSNPKSTVAMTEGETMFINNYCNKTESQWQRILDRLRTGPLTTLEARTELDVMHPSARCLELRKLGHNIQTHWETVDTGKAKHRVARYVLLSGVADGQ